MATAYSFGVTRSMP